MSIPNYTDTTYTISISAPGHKVCSIAIGFQGVNIPCLNSASPPVYTPSSTPQQAVWNLGRIRNGGQRSTALDPSANTIQFIIYVLPTQTAGAVTVTLQYGTAASINRISTVNLVPAAALSVIQFLLILSFKINQYCICVLFSINIFICICMFMYLSLCLYLVCQYYGNTNIFCIGPQVLTTKARLSVLAALCELFLGS